MNWDLIFKGLTNPLSSYRYLMARFKGICYKMWFKLFHSNVEIGKKLVVLKKARLDINGPGKVIINDNVTIIGHVTPWTYSKSAEINIGKGTKMDGTKFGCQNKIVIGSNCYIGLECRIMDTDFHSIFPDKRDDPAFIKTAPVIINDNVWITMRCLILKGITIGSNSTVLPQSVVSKDLPSWSLCGGNPAVFVKKIESNFSIVQQS